jgi:hypothetical protein
MGEYTTKYVFRTPDTKDRANNIELAASNINNTIIPQGSTFSYNDSVGPRTFKLGFREAHAIVKKKIVDEMGGGICQVSGTLFAAAYMAGLDIMEAHTHSRASTYIKPGLDATVNWGSLDLKIRNPFVFPVTIQTKITEEPTKWGGKLRVLTVTVLGIKQPVTVTLTEKYRKKFRKFSIRRSDLPKGYRKLYQPGTNAYIIERVRTRKVNGQTLIDNNTIKYSASDRITIIGTK